MDQLKEAALQIVLAEIAVVHHLSAGTVTRRLPVVVIPGLMEEGDLGAAIVLQIVSMA